MFLLVLLSVASVFFCYGSFAMAEEDIGFSVKAITPSNQIDLSHSYFDLKMVPGIKQTLEVNILNTSNEDITLEISANNASTNSNGIIEYKKSDIKDETLLIPFEEIAKVIEPTVIVPANRSKTVHIEIKMPDISYDGVVLGGIFIKKINEDAPVNASSSDSLSLRNVYSYVIGVKLSETETLVEPDFELLSVAPENVNYHTVIVAGIRNKEAAIAKNISLTVSIYEDTKITPLVTYQKSSVDMAPNSVMPFSVPWESGALMPGDYRATIHMEQDGKAWDFEMPFTIDTENADIINKNDVGNSENTPAGFPIFWIILVAALLLIVAILIILLIRKRKKEDDGDIVKF